MSTIGKHIAVIRGMLNTFSETEAPYSAEAIYMHLKASAAAFTRQKYDRTNVMNYQNFRNYAIATEPTDLVNCGCAGGCQFLVTTQEIPEMLMVRSGPLLYVKTLGMVDIPYVDFAYAPSLQYDEILKNKIVYSLFNKKIVLHNTDLKRPRAIVVGGMAADPAAWVGIRTCDQDGNNTGVACASIMDAEMMIDADLEDLIYTQTVQKLRTGGQPSDRTNEGSNT